MINYSIQLEILTVPLIAELVPLLELHKEEILPYSDMKVNPDWSFYMSMSEVGSWNLFTVRLKATGEIIGYMSMFITPALIDYRFTQAQQDGLFIHEDYRKGMICAKLIAFADSWLAEQGVSYTSQRVHKGVDFSPILERQGYEYVEKQYMRRLN